MKLLPAITLLSALLAVACKPVDDRGKAEHSQKARITQEKAVAADKPSSGAVASAMVVSFRGAGGPISVAADDAQLMKRGDDFHVILPEVRIQKHIGGDVQFNKLRFMLTRRVRTETGNYIGSSDEDPDVKGVLTDDKPWAVFKNARLRYKGAASECPDGCLMALRIWAGYGDKQSGGLSDAVEISVK